MLEVSTREGEKYRMYDEVDATFAALKSSDFMAKIDIAGFLRHIPMGPADWWAL